MGWGYHQIKLDERIKRQNIFHTHGGLHRKPIGKFRQIQRKWDNSQTLQVNVRTNRIKWFGRTFHSNGVTAAPQKIQNIEGRPKNTGDVRLLLMACQYNVISSHKQKKQTIPNSQQSPH